MVTEAEIISIFNDEGDALTMELDSEWEQDHKYQCRQTVWKHIPSGEYWEVMESRSGSPFTDWDYDEPSARRVYRKEETKVVVTWSANE